MELATQDSCVSWDEGLRDEEAVRRLDRPFGAIRTIDALAGAGGGGLSSKGKTLTRDAACACCANPLY